MPDYRALIVDDEPDVAEALAMLLVEEDCEVRVVHSGAEALALAGEFQPLCVLLDLGMPGMSGAEMAGSLRARFGYDVVLIAITGYDTLSLHAKHARELGVDYVMTKPIDFDKLVEIMGLRS